MKKRQPFPAISQPALFIPMGRSNHSEMYQSRCPSRDGHGHQEQRPFTRNLVHFLGPQLGYLADTDGVDGVLDNVSPKVCVSEQV